jgi:hypothetical protein
MIIMARKTKEADQAAEQTPQVTRPELDLGSMVVETDLSRTDMALHRRTRVVRSDKQKAIDAIVEAAWKAWTEAGRPTSWVEQPGRLVTVPAEQWETAVYMIRRGGTFYDLKIRFGDVDTFEKDGVQFSQAVFTATERPAGEQPDSDQPAEDGDQAEDGGQADEDARLEQENVDQQSDVAPY